MTPLDRHFELYAEYHRHPTNRLTHKIAIPLIVFHVIAMLDWIALWKVPGTECHLTAAHLAYVATIGWYCTLHLRLALVMAVLYALCFPLGWITPKPLVVAIAILGWLIQLAGHSVWEKNRPAFLVNMQQALIGPLFFAAVLLGYWPPKRD